MKTIHLLLTILLVGAVFTACAPAGGPSQPVTGSQPVFTEPPAPSAQLPTLRIVAPQYMIDDGLQETIQSAINNANLADRIRFVLEGYPSPLPGKIMLMCMAPDIPFLFPDSQANTNPDLMLVDSQSVFQFDPARISMVPDPILKGSGLTESALRAYTDGKGRIIGLAQGTRPIMIVYNSGDSGQLPAVWNPDSNNPLELPWGDMDTILKNLDGKQITVPPMSAVIAAEIQGMGKSPEEIFDNPTMLIEIVNAYGDRLINTSKSVSSYDPNNPDNKMPFDYPQVAFTIADGTYLSRMVNSKQTVDVLPLPSMEAGQTATSTQMLGWVVPEKTSDPDLSWLLADTLVKDKGMNQFGMRYGLLPVTEAGIANMGDWAKDYMLLPGNLQTLQDLARNSVAWHIPERFSSQACREKFNSFMLDSDQQVVKLVDRSSSQIDIANTVIDLLKSLSKCKP